ncbi:HK97 gp10 family phage protein [Streptomyces phytophilus]|uniref:HK97 gp10 family phage protein n=1 Tax=Streptomyces phytophilus TaxID=722715 RepID=UPI0015F02412|nr:HK97 gp10 family phage protein [Streptomyces phytophilus]
MPAKFRMSSKGVGQLLRSPMVETEMLRRGHTIKGVAVATSPTGDAARDPHPGLYKASWHVKSSRRGGWKKDRATATVYNTAPHAKFVEYGTENHPGRHILLRAAQIGGRN